MQRTRFCKFVFLKVNSNKPASPNNFITPITFFTHYPCFLLLRE